MLLKLVSTFFKQKGRDTMKTLKKKWDRLFSAIAFAEAGEVVTARELLRGEETPQINDRVSKSDAARHQMRTREIKR